MEQAPLQLIRRGRLYLGSCSTRTSKRAFFVVGERVYPNPSEGQFTIQLPKNAPLGIYQIRLYNTDAKRVWGSESLSGEEGQWQISFDHLPKGIYWLRISGIEVFTKRIIIQ